jgi:hypothetical protein
MLQLSNGYSREQGFGLRDVGGNGVKHEDGNADYLVNLYFK